MTIMTATDHDMPHRRLRSIDLRFVMLLLLLVFLLLLILNMMLEVATVMIVVVEMVNFQLLLDVYFLKLYRRASVVSCDVMVVVVVVV